MAVKLVNVTWIVWVSGPNEGLTANCGDPTAEPVAVGLGVPPAGSTSKVVVATRPAKSTAVMVSLPGVAVAGMTQVWLAAPWPSNVPLHSVPRGVRSMLPVALSCTSYSVFGVKLLSVIWMDCPAGPEVGLMTICAALAAVMVVALAIRGVAKLAAYSP